MHRYDLLLNMDASEIVCMGMIWFTGTTKEKKIIAQIKWIMAYKQLPIGIYKGKTGREAITLVKLET